MNLPGSPTGVQLGHWDDLEAKTGCTVVLFDHLTPSIVDIRGAAPGTRETDLLGPDMSVGAVDAILLTGGSAHGLSAADGVMEYFRGLGRGVPTQAGSVPIVSAAVIYDLAVGQATWPTPDSALRACKTAAPLGEVATGGVGAGMGATYRKAWPHLTPLPGGIGIAPQSIAELGTVWAIVVLNAIGDTQDHRALLLGQPGHHNERANTTLVAIVLDGPADTRTMRRCAVAAHDGLARSIKPAHTQFDGDAAFVSALHPVAANEPAQSFQWTIATELAVEAAIRQITERNT